MKFEGFVKKINVKEGRGARGPWKAYSAKLENSEGKEFDAWVSLGFDPPPFKEGDYVQLETAEENGRQQLVKGSVKVKKNPPARGGGKSAPQPSKGPGDAVATASGPSNDERQKSITYQSSRKDAIELVKLLLTSDALPISAAKTKAGEQKRFDEITAAVEKFTVELYQDVMTLRVVARVADAGVVKADTKARDSLPEDSDDKSDQDDTDAAGPDEGDGWEE